MKKILLLIYCLLFALIVNSQTTIVNHEQFNTNAVPTVPAAWTKGLWDLYKDYSTNCHNAGSEIRVASTGSANTNSYFWIPITYQNGYTYNFDLWRKNALNMKIVFNETADLTTPLSTQTVVNATGTWQNITFTGYASTYAGSGYIGICATSNNGATMYVDDITLTATAPVCTPPVSQATSFVFSNVTSNSTQLSWTRGGGNNVLIVARAGSAPTDPVNDQIYAASVSYGAGDACGSGFVVYNGTGTNVTITGLARNTTYHYAAFEYNSTGTCYNMTQLTGSQLTSNGIGYYYVNDASIDGDIFCTGVGSNTSNYGRGPATPALTFRWLWNQYGPSGTNEIVDGDVIYVDKGHYISAVAVPNNQNYGYSFTQDITIQGAGNTNTIFDNNFCGIAGGFYFADIRASVTIKDIQFTKYASNSDGQCFQISSTGSPGVVFTDVLTNTNGGSSMYAAIAINSNSIVNITGGGMNCNGDASHGASGGIDVKGTSITLNVTNASFIGNYKSSSAAIGDGAGLSITAANSTTDVTLKNCLFAGCHTDNDGASGGSIKQTTGDLVMEDCIIEDSQTYQNSTKYGGAMYLTGGTTIMTRCLVQNNTNAGGSTYGNICVWGGALTLTDCKFTGNTSDAQGLGLSDDVDIYCKTGTVTATNTAFLSSIEYNIYNAATTSLTTCGTPTNTGSPTFINNDSPSTFSTPSTPTYTGDCSSGILLPIELVEFKANCVIGGIKLDWTTASEFNNDFFTIERSYDGLNWEIVSFLDGSGNSNSYLDYYIFDVKFDYNKKIIYYHLKQTDFDGRSETFEPIAISNCYMKYSKKLIKVINVLGEDVPETTKNQIIIKIYDDGTVEKVLNFF